MRSIAVLVAGIAAVGLPSSAGATNPVASENALAGTTDWAIGQSNFREVEGYASEISVAPGDTLQLHVQTTPVGRYRVEIYRLGWYGGSGGRLVACLPTCTTDEPGVPQPVPPFDPSTGLVAPDWPVTDSLAIPSDWVSGYYLADLVLTSKPSTRVGSRVPFVVLAPPTRNSQVLVQVPVNTWEAYNDWGSRSLYFPNRTGVGDNHVAFARPFEATPFTQGTQMQWELPFLRFLERHGYDVSYQTDRETDADPGSLLRHRLVVATGHSEYWTKTMRDAFERARDAGTNLAFIGADQSYWQIDYADTTRGTLIEYRNPALDPQPDESLKTTWFRHLVPPRPECTLLGSQFPDEPDDSGIGTIVPYTATDAASNDPWFAGTGFHAGDVLTGLVGGEWNAIEPGCATPPLTVLFHYEGAPANADAVRYTAPSGARVFTSGSLQFAAGLDDNRFLPDYTGLEDARLEHFMQNAFADLTRPAPPTGVVVHRGVRLRIAVARHADARVRGIDVYRHTGAGVFSLTAPGVRRICAANVGVCVDRRPVHGRVRYAAVAVDQWGRSAPVYSTAVTTR